jgi:hypothetical protein
MNSILIDTRNKAVRDSDDRIAVIPRKSTYLFGMSIVKGEGGLTVKKGDTISMYDRRRIDALCQARPARVQP